MSPNKDRARGSRLLIVLVLLGLLLLTISYGASGGGQAGGAFGPFAKAASAAGKPFRDLVNWVKDTAKATSERDKVMEELSQLRRDQAKLATLAGQSQALRKQLKLEQIDALKGRQLVRAGITVQAPTDWAATMRINRGTSSGIKADDPVLAADSRGGGLIGFISRADGGSAVVKLLQSSDFNVGARIEGTTTRRGGVLQGIGAGKPDLQLNFVPARTPIELKKIVYTTGTVPNDRGIRSLAPKGIPIGRVSSVDDQNADTQVVHVEPFVNPRSLEDVSVLISSGG